MKRTLLFRLTLLYTVAFSVVAAIGFTSFYYRIYSVTIERMDEELAEKAKALGLLAERNGIEAVRIKIAGEIEGEDPEEEFYRIIDENSEILMSTDMSAWGDVDRHNVVAQIKNNNSPFITQTIAIPEIDVTARLISAPINAGLILQIGESLEETEEYLEIFMHHLLLLVIGLILLSAIIGWLLAKRSLSDMQEVTRVAEDIAKGDYDRRVSISAQFQEIDRLGEAFNTMLERIQALLQTMKEINDNIAHDLRSPLARIRGVAEMAILSDDHKDDFNETAASIIEECDTLIDIINMMLDITQAEAGVPDGNSEKFDISTLVLDAYELFRPSAEQKKINLHTSFSPQLLFEGNRKRMQRIVTNVLENAIKFTPENGSVLMSVNNIDGQIRITIEDTGTGISPTDLPHIFKRFYRCEHSRTQGGVGLGLSLVKAYTESMHGTIQVKSIPEQGSVFTLSFSS